MNGRATIKLENDTFFISGDLDFNSVVGLQDQCQLLFENCSALQFDFSKVTSANSAAIALILEWISYAKQKNKKIDFHHLPMQLQSIAKVCGVWRLLG